MPSSRPSVGARLVAWAIRSLGGSTRASIATTRRAPVAPYTSPLPPDEQVFSFATRFPRFNPSAVAAWLDTVAPTERIAAADALGWRWLRLLVPAMSEPHALSESPHFYLLSVPKAAEVRRMLAFLEDRRTQVLLALAAAGPATHRPRHLVVVCGSKADYDLFYADAIPEEERDLAGSGGVFISDGSPHIALSSASLTDAHATLIHELVHACLEHLSLPAWLDEGLTQLLEYELVSWRPFHLDREVRDKHRAHWTADTIQQFWSGRAFSLPGDSQQLSYNLAVILVRSISTLVADGREDLWAFVREADRADSGDAAFRAQFGITLQDLVADFLGPGDWAPRPIEPNPVPRDGRSRSP